MLLGARGRLPSDRHHSLRSLRAGAVSNGKMLVMSGNAGRERVADSLVVPVVITRPRAGWRRVAVVGCLGLGTAGIGFVAPWVGPVHTDLGWLSLVVTILAGLTMLGAGLIAWLRQPANAIWRLMVASYFAGFIWEVAFKRAACQTRRSAPHPPHQVGRSWQVRCCWSHW